jgi:hypothetical protein
LASKDKTNPEKTNQVKKPMKNTLLLVLIQSAVLSTSAVANCYYTGVEVCAPAGTTLSSQPVQCRWSGGWATLYNTLFTEQDAFRPKAKPLDYYNTSGRVGIVAAAIINTVSVGQTTNGV